MINPVFLLSGAGMMLAGLLPLMWWRYRTLVPWRDFFLGSAMWALAVSIKLVMDFSVTPLFVGWLSGIYTALGIAIITGAYVGLRTGFFESGFTYMAAARTRMKRYDFQQAVAFGLGFGCAEAFLLGLSSFLNISVILAFPQIIDLMPAAQRVAVLEALSMPSIAAIAPVIERVSTIMVHVFCSVLVIQSVRTGRAAYFMSAFLIKTAIDGMLPMLTLNFSTKSVAGIYSIEAIIAAIGLASFAGLLLLKGKYGKYHKHKTSRRKSILVIALVTILIISFSVAFARPNLASPIERRTVNFDDFQGRYDFWLNDSRLGYSEFEYAGKAGDNIYVIRESTNLSAPAYEMFIEGELHVTLDARPVFYNMTIHKNGDVKNIICEFSDGTVTQRETENNSTDTRIISTDPDSFIIANNMISNWALLFRAAVLEPKSTYIAHIYSPNMGAGMTIPLSVVSVQNITVNSRNYEVYVFQDRTGNLNYITPDGLLLKVENQMLKITLGRDYQQEPGGMFR